jgi:hypothetical protein
MIVLEPFMTSMIRITLDLKLLNNMQYFDAGR